MTRLPPVTIVCPNVSGNALGRALLLADLLRNDTKVQVVGVRLHESVWPPARGSQVPILDFPLAAGRRHYLDAVSWLRKVAAEDCVIVSKPVLHSLGLALLARVGQRGFVLDIDDWQTGFFQIDGAKQGLSAFRQRVARFRSYARRGGLNGFTLTRLLEAYAARIPHRLVSNRWLERRFGGEVLYHVRDPSLLDPDEPPTGKLRPLPKDLSWVGFVGTPRHHKGLRVLVDAVAEARQHVPLGLALIGSEDYPDDPAILHARRTLPSHALVLMPTFPLEELRDHLRLADIIAIPSLDVPGSWGQVPAKLFDAMSMAKPIVASAVNDIPRILSEVGICVPGGDPSALASGLVRLARDSDLRKQLGLAARARLIENYSYDAGRKILTEVVRRAARHSR